MQPSPSNHHPLTWKLFTERSPSNIQHSLRQTLAPPFRSPTLSNSRHQLRHFPQYRSLPKHITPFPSDIITITMTMIHNLPRSISLMVSRVHHSSNPVIVPFLSQRRLHRLPLLQHQSLRNSSIKPILLVRFCSPSPEREAGTAI